MTELPRESRAPTSPAEHAGSGPHGYVYALPPGAARVSPWLVLFTVAAILLTYRLGAKDLWERAEARSVVFGRDLADGDHLLVPEIFGEPFVDNRPPGYYWIVGWVYRLTGSRSIVVARIPAVLSALACLLVVYLFAGRLAGGSAGLVAGLILLGMFKFTWQARVAEQDMTLALFTTLGYWAFWRFTEDGARSIAWAALFHLSVGMAAMIKGPVIGLTLVIPILAYLTLFGRWRTVRWRPLLATAVISVALSVWWYIAVWFGLPEERAQLIGRFANQGELHARPWYYYLVKAPTIFGPALLLLPWLWIAWRRPDRASTAGRAMAYFVCWFLGNVLVFSLIVSKQTHYLVPAAPGLALALVLALDGSSLHRFRGLLWTWSGAVAFLPVAMAGWIIFAPEDMRSPRALVGWLACAMAAGLTVLLFRKMRSARPAEALMLSWAVWLVALLWVLGEVVPVQDASRSPRRFASQVERVVPPEGRLATLTNHPALLCYLDRSITLKSPSEARSFLEASPSNYLISLDRDLGGVDTSGLRVALQAEDYMRQGRVVRVYHLPR